MVVSKGYTRRRGVAAGVIAVELGLPLVAVSLGKGHIDEADHRKSQDLAPQSKHIAGGRHVDLAIRRSINFSVWGAFNVSIRWTLNISIRRIVYVPVWRPFNVWGWWDVHFCV